MQGQIADHVADSRLIETLTSNLCGMEIVIASQRTPCKVQLAMVDLGSVSLSGYRSQGLHHGHRSWSHVRSDPDEYYFVQIPVSAEYDICHNGATTSVPPGSFVFLASTAPFEISERLKTSVAGFSTMIARIPAPLLRRHCPQIDEICNTRFEVSPGAARMMRNIVEAALEDGAALTPGQAACFGTAVADAVANAAEWAATASGRFRLRNERSRDAIIQKAKAFIAARLADATLDRARVAAHCRVSVRYLHSVFQASGETVASHIRELRLLRCRDMLRNPALRRRTITQIAGEWGFADPSHFSSAYKLRFGHAPRQDRHGSDAHPPM